MLPELIESTYTTERTNLIERYLPFSKEPEIVKLGNMAVGWASWGDYLSTADYIRQLGPGLKKLDRDVIESLRFGGGYHYPAYVDILGDEVQSQQAQHGAAFIEALLQSRGWNGVDLLIVASSSTKPESVYKMREILEKKSVGVKTMKMSMLFCAGVSAAFMDAIRDESLEKAQVAIIGIDSLGGSFVRPDDILTPALFGNAVGGFAFKPQEDVEFVNGSTHIRRDEFGVIKVPAAYSLPDHRDRISFPVGYEVDPNATEIFAVSKEGMFLQAATPSGKYVEIDSKENFNYFSLWTPPIAASELAQNYYPAKKRGEAVNPIVSHQPGYPIFLNVGKNLFHRLRDLGFTFDFRTDLRWVMNESINNVSPVTIPVAMTEMRKRRMLEPNRLTGIIGMGIGSTIHAGAFIPRK